MPAHRTALLIRCTAGEAARLREAARAEHRTVSGYLLHLLERSLWIEEKFRKGLAPRAQSAGSGRLSRVQGGRTGILLRCSTDEAERIRKAAARRGMSISEFVVFSLHRHWHAVEEVRASAANFSLAAGGRSE